MENTMKTARIFYESDGYHISDDSLSYLDARGKAYKSRSAAIKAAKEMGYTRFV